MDWSNWYFYKTSATFGDIDEFLEIQVWLILPTKYQLLFILTVQITRIVRFFFYPVHLQNMQLVATIIMAKSHFGKLCLKFVKKIFYFINTEGSSSGALLWCVFLSIYYGTMAIFLHTVASWPLSTYLSNVYSLWMEMTGKVALHITHDLIVTTSHRFHNHIV